jgi:5-methyltetrahydrofolate--homocysteine methyltransferase
MGKVNTMSQLEQLGEAVGTGAHLRAKQLTEELLEEGESPDKLLAAMVKAMDELGKRFECHEAYVPDLLVSARAMNEAMKPLAPRLLAAGIKPKHRAVIGTVTGDLHDIGKNLVAIMWKAAGFDVLDLGVNVAPEKFVAAAADFRPHVIGLSALLTTTMPAIGKTIEALNVARDSGVKIVIGGAPVTQNFADQVGADGYAPDASAAVGLVRRLLGIHA